MQCSVKKIAKHAFSDCEHVICTIKSLAIVQSNELSTVCNANQWKNQYSL